MSVRIMSRVWDSGPKDRGELLVLLALADFSNDGGESWPSVKSIADKARMDERSARRILRKLEASGWLTSDVGGGRHGCSRYRINPDTSPPGQNVPPDKTRRKPGQNAPETRTPVSPEPSRTIIEPSKKSAREEGDILEALCHALSEPVAGDFIAHRRTKRSPLTLKAAQLIAKKLAMHPDPDSVVEESIANGWTGVFPDRVNSQKMNGVQYGNGNHNRIGSGAGGSGSAMVDAFAAVAARSEAAHGRS